MVVGEEEDMIAAIRAVAFTDLDAEDSPILSYRFDGSEIVISASCQDYQAELPCIIDTLNFDYENGVMVGVSKYN